MVYYKRKIIIKIVMNEKISSRANAFKNSHRLKRFPQILKNVPKLVVLVLNEE